MPSAYSQAMSTFTAQNMGAGKPERARKALLYGIASSFAVGIVMAWFSFFHGDVLASLFVKGTEPAVIAAAADYLKSYAIDCLLTAFLFCLLGFFNGCGKTVFVMAQGLIGAFAIRIPIAFWMDQIGGSLFQIGLATPASTLVQIILCGIYFMLLRKHQKYNLQ